MLSPKPERALGRLRRAGSEIYLSAQQPLPPSLHSFSLLICRLGLQPQPTGWGCPALPGKVAREPEKHESGGRIQSQHQLASHPRCLPTGSGLSLRIPGGTRATCPSVIFTVARAVSCSGNKLGNGGSQ